MHEPADEVCDHPAVVLVQQCDEFDERIGVLPGADGALRLEVDIPLSRRP